MEKGLLHLHNLMRWVILILLLISIVKAYMGWQGKKAFQASDKKIWLFTMIAGHITLLVGLCQWLAGRYGILTSKLPEGTSMMKDRFFRFYWLEHPLTMILAIVFLTIAHGTAKKPLTDEVKYRKAFWLFVIALALIIIGVPWPGREILGRPLLP